MSIWIVVALVSSLAALVWGGYLAWRMRVSEESRAKQATYHFDHLQQQISMLQRDFEQLARHAPQAAKTSPSSKAENDATPYTQAIELVKHGLSAAEVAERCGISRSEAELIVSLYRNNSPS